MIHTEVKHLFYKELIAEYRNKYSLGGVFLYVFSTIFIGYLSFRNIIEVPVWNALFWIIFLFAAINAVAKSFIAENSGRLLYMYQLASPQAILLAKTFANVLLMLVVGLLHYVLYSLFIGNIIADKLLFLLILAIAAIGFASMLTMVSAIAAKANQNLTLMAVLSFPLLMPFLIVLIKVAKNAMDGLDRGLSYKYIFILILINLIVFGLSYLLFPYLWRD